MTEERTSVVSAAADGFVAVSSFVVTFAAPTQNLFGCSVSAETGEAVAAEAAVALTAPVAVAAVRAGTNATASIVVTPAAADGLAGLRRPEVVAIVLAWAAHAAAAAVAAFAGFVTAAVDAAAAAADVAIVAIDAAAG